MVCVLGALRVESSVALARLMRSSCWILGVGFDLLDAGRAHFGFVTLLGRGVEFTAVRVRCATNGERRCDGRCGEC